MARPNLRAWAILALALLALPFAAAALRSLGAIVRVFQTRSARSNCEADVCFTHSVRVTISASYFHSPSFIT
jgi:hypothetical protein